TGCRWADVGGASLCAHPGGGKVASVLGQGNVRKSIIDNIDRHCVSLTAGDGGGGAAPIETVDNHIRGGSVGLKAPLQKRHRSRAKAPRGLVEILPRKSTPLRATTTDGRFLGWRQAQRSPQN